MELGVDYKFRDDLFNKNEAGTTVPIELLLDPFKGVCYCYTSVKFKVDEDQVPRMLFNYEILKTNDLSMMTLRKNEKFNTMLGLILNALIIDAQEGGADEVGASNPKEPDNQGGLHAESTSVSEG